MLELTVPLYFIDGFRFSQETDSIHFFYIQFIFSHLFFCFKLSLALFNSIGFFIFAVVKPQPY